MRLRFSFLLILAMAWQHAGAHAPVLPPVVGPIRANRNLLVDSPGNTIVLRGLNMPGLEVIDPPSQSLDAQSVAAMTSAGFGIVRLRWNMNAVRLPVSVRAWLRDGQQYLDRVAEIVRLANDRDLAVVIAACEDARSGTPNPSGLPSADTVAFWHAWAARFKDNPRVVFDVFHEPSARNVPGALAGVRTVADWMFWGKGGTTVGGQRVAGMQELVDVIRSTGAQQLIAVSAFHDALGFQRLTPELQIRDDNILYEVHPYYQFGLTNESREASFGALSARVPVYAGEWGATLRDGGPGCLALPPDPQGVTTILFDTLLYFESKQISWTAASFRPGSLVSDFVDFQPTVLDRQWNCGEAANPQPGMGEALILWTTGDPSGFGSLRATQIANAAGGPPGPVVPGQLLSIYAEQLGPFPEAFARFDEAGKLPLNLSGTQVFFDAVPAPILYAGPFQINVQVPYTLEPGRNTTVQAFFRGVPSNRIKVDVAGAAAELFQDFATRSAIALNENGSRNTSANPAAAGSIVVLFGSGGGQTFPAGTTGTGAPFPHPTLANGVTLTVDAQPCNILFAGEVPGFVGLLQINARLPASFSSAGRHAAPVSLVVGAGSSRSHVFIWVF